MNVLVDALPDLIQTLVFIVTGIAVVWVGRGKAANEAAYADVENARIDNRIQNKFVEVTSTFFEENRVLRDKVDRMHDRELEREREMGQLKVALAESERRLLTFREHADAELQLFINEKAQDRQHYETQLAEARDAQRSLEARVSELTKEMERLKTLVYQLQNEKQQAELKAAASETKVTKLREDMGNLETEYARTVADRERLQKENNNLRASLGSLRDEMDTLRVTLATMEKEDEDGQYTEQLGTDHIDREHPGDDPDRGVGDHSDRAGEPG